MSAGDELLAMLDAVAERQIRCPVCGQSNNPNVSEKGIHLVYADWRYLPVAFPIGGGILATDFDSDYCTPPQEMVVGVPDLLCCNNGEGHPGGNAHWWPVPDGVEIDWSNPNLAAEILEGGV